MEIAHMNMTPKPLVLLNICKFDFDFMPFFLKRTTLLAQHDDTPREMVVDDDTPRAKVVDDDTSSAVVPHNVNIISTLYITCVVGLD